MPLAAAVKELSATFNGQLLQPGDAGYDDARRVHNGLIDKRPALVACCRGTADVVDAVKLARSLSLDIAVRGGGHNVAGRAALDGGVMIDLAPMRGIHVNPKARTARAQGGVRWNEFNRETQLHALATTGGVVGTTGIAGLTLRELSSNDSMTAVFRSAVDRSVEEAEADGCRTAQSLSRRSG